MGYEGELTGKGSTPFEFRIPGFFIPPLRYFSSLAVPVSPAATALLRCSAKWGGRGKVKVIQREGEIFRV